MKSQYAWSVDIIPDIPVCLYETITNIKHNDSPYNRHIGINYQFSMLLVITFLELLKVVFVV